jgi:hypothetical protein
VCLAASADNRNGARQTVSDESSAFFTPAPVNGRSRLSNDSENEREYRDTVECGVLDKGKSVDFLRLLTF